MSSGHHPRPSRLRRGVVLWLATVVVTGTLAACSSADSGPPVLTWYINPDVGNLDPSKGGQAALAKKCTEAADGAYQIDVQLLPNEASEQRQQLVRRLAAQDSSIDLMSLDPPFLGEFATAGFLAPVPAGLVKKFSEDILDAPLQNATWDGELVAVPFWANTQLLWFRRSVAAEAGLDMSRPVTWDQIIKAAQQTGTTVQVQANLYEGYSVWINALIESAGGHVVDNIEAGQDATVEVDSEAGRTAASIIEELADSGAANKALAGTTETEALAGFTADDGGFIVNWSYTFSDPSTAALRDSNDLGWTTYPESVAGEQSKPPLGGINLAVGAFSEHPDLAYDAAECIASPQSQKSYMLASGNPASSSTVYDDPDVRQAVPMSDDIRASVDRAAARPSSPYWSDISTALYSTFHPPSDVDPDTTPQEAQQFIEDVLHGEALL